MSRRSVADLRRGDYVWIARTWPWPVVYHDRAERDDRGFTVGERTALVAGWALARCGILVHELTWEPGWSDERGRFAVGRSRGDDLPLRLLNLDETRPCRKCFDVTESG